MIFHPRFLFGGVRLANIFFVMSIYVSEFRVVVFVTIPELNVHFIFSSSCQQERSCLIYVSCVCLRIVVFNTQCFVFVFCLASACVPYQPVSLNCPFLIARRYISRVYYTQTHDEVKKAFYCCSSYFVILFHVYLLFC